ncbi:bile acid-CoA:amino acid N-acyltransferase-like [Oculina patagonica]
MGEDRGKGVIDMLGGPGGLVEFKASLLASRGFAALALAYMDYEDLPRNQLAMDMEYFEEAANWLSNHPKVLPHGIGVHASSYGALMALLMASLQLNAVKAIVAISPLVVAFHPYKYKGKISDVLPFENSKIISTEEGVVLRYAFLTITDYKPSASKYPPIPPVENISCPVLLVYGTDDLNVNCDFSAELIFKDP